MNLWIYRKYFKKWCTDVAKLKLKLKNYLGITYSPKKDQYGAKTGSVLAPYGAKTGNPVWHHMVPHGATWCQKVPKRGTRFWSNDHFQGECYLFLGISKKIMLFRTLFLNILSYITFTIPNISDIAVPYLDVYLCSGFYMMLLTNINTWTWKS